MRDDGSDLKRLKDELDVNATEIAFEANLNPQTVYAVLRNEASSNSVNRVRKALRSIQEKRNARAKTG
jgi:predicted transcriptional regulator